MLTFRFDLLSLVYICKPDADEMADKFTLGIFNCHTPVFDLRHH